MRTSMAVFTRTATAILFLAFALLRSPAAQADKFKVIYAFSNGGQPYAGVILDAAGNLYGTTTGGFEGEGTVFELSPGSGGWTESTLHGFSGGSDGGIPEDSVIFDASGNLYGTAQYGGESCGHNSGCGVVFELSPHSGEWTETVLHSFQGGADGYYPIASLVFDKQGNLYSTMSNGGSAEVGQVYELTQDGGVWQKDILYDFSAGGVGAEPIAAPTFDAAGNLYDMTSCCGSAVFELLHGSWDEKTLSKFESGGDDPFGGLILDKAGNLYGTTTGGGGKYGKGKGVVFKLTKSKGSGEWKETVLYTFKGGRDGNRPYSTLAFDKSGNLYGTTYWGGDPSCDAYGCGTVFKLTPGKNGRWKETVLHRFTGPNDGQFPYFVKLAIDPAGNLYGTTLAGGNPGCYLNLGCGVVFEITP